MADPRSLPASMPQSLSSLASKRQELHYKAASVKRTSVIQSAIEIQTENISGGVFIRVQGWGIFRKILTGVMQAIMASDVAENFQHPEI